MLGGNIGESQYRKDANFISNSASEIVKKSVFKLIYKRINCYFVFVTFHRNVFLLKEDAKFNIITSLMQKHTRKATNKYFVSSRFVENEF